MATGWSFVRPEDEDARDDKPGKRWELSSDLEIDAFNFNTAILEPGDRLSSSHFHYHENQDELVYVADGRCQIEVADDRLIAEAGDTIRFRPGPDGVHLVHNPFDSPCRLVAIGWRPEDRFPVEQVKTTEELLEERGR